MSTKNDFATWALDNADWLTHHKIRVEDARMIWDASSVNMTNKYIEMVYSGEIKIITRPE